MAAPEMAAASRRDAALTLRSSEGRAERAARPRRRRVEGDGGGVTGAWRRPSERTS